MHFQNIESIEQNLREVYASYTEIIAFSVVATATTLEDLLR